MAYCYPRGRVWWIGWVDENNVGQRAPTKLLVGKTKRDQRESEFNAQKLATELEQKAERVRLRLDEPDVKPMLFSELVEKYLAIVASGKKSAGTMETRIRGHLLPYFGGRLAHLIGPVDVDEFLGKRGQGAPCAECAGKCEGKHGKGKPKDGSAPCPCAWKCHRKQSLQSRKHFRNHLQAIFRFGIKLKVVRGANPAAEAEPVDVPKRMPRVAPSEFLEQFLAVADDDVRAIFAVCLYTGLRKGEVLGLRPEDVRLDLGIIQISRSHGSNDTKTSDFRPVAIPPDLVPYLKVELGRVRGEFLFVNEAGERHRHDWDLANRVRTTLVRAGLVLGYDFTCRRCATTKRHADDAPRNCSACGMKLWVSAVPPDLTLKDLRSTFATLAYEMTDDGKYVQKALGHRDPRTTDRYLRMRDQQLLKQGAKMKIPTHNQLTRENPSTPAATGVEEKTAMTSTTSTMRSEGVEPTTFGSGGHGEHSPERFRVASTGFNSRSTASESAGVASSGSKSNPVTHIRLTKPPKGGGR